MPISYPDSSVEECEDIDIIPTLKQYFSKAKPKRVCGIAHAVYKGIEIAM